MGFNEQVDQLAVKKLKSMWGGTLPTWNDYKKAAKSGRVRANKTLAAQAIYMNGMPKPYFIIYGIVTLWLGFLIFPATIIAWFFMDFNAWWILGAFLTAWYLVKVSRNGQCEGMKHVAEKNEELYEILVKNGAFLFSPESE